MSEAVFEVPVAHRLEWRWRAFADISSHELQRIHIARQQVFVCEQQCVYLDADPCDEQSQHLAAWATERRLPVAYARLIPPGIKYPEAAIGRVLVEQALRRGGLGRQLVQRVLDQATLAWPWCGVRVSAQARLQAFYAGFGFEPVGMAYLEDGIEHLDMRRLASA